MAKSDRGFASMDKAKQREIASKGGKAAHRRQTAHEWTGGPDGTAAIAGRKGGQISHQRRRERRMQAASAAGQTTADAGVAQS